MIGIVEDTTMAVRFLNQRKRRTRNERRERQGNESEREVNEGGNGKGGNTSGVRGNAHMVLIAFLIQAVRRGPEWIRHLLEALRMLELCVWNLSVLPGCCDMQNRHPSLEEAFP